MLLILVMVNIFGTSLDTLGGANQLSLLLAAAVAGSIATYNRVSWDHLLKSIVSHFATAVPAILILLMVGAFSGSWMTSGIIPTMIYYGLEILRPEYFLPATVIITSIISLATGSSWTTVATIGVALIGVGHALGIDAAWSAGAIISGAYFGDKLSPLSDTTNLAATVAKVDLFEHIKFMLYTTVPSIIVTIVIFIAIGLLWGNETAPAATVPHFKEIIENTYRISLWMLLVPVAVIFLIVKKIPAIPLLLIGSLLGVVVALFFQQEYLQSHYGNNPLTVAAYYELLTQTLFGSFGPITGNIAIDELFATGGMGGMMNTVWLIITAMTFAGTMAAGGFIERISEAILIRVKSRAGLVTATSATGVVSNLTSSDQYVSIVISGEIYLSSFEKKGEDKCLLSRTIEDSVTVTSVLVPWNTCGATQASILGVATTAYLPFAFFCWLSPLMTLAMAWTNTYQKRKVFPANKK